MNSYGFGWFCPCNHERAYKWSPRDLPGIEPEDRLDTNEICRFCGTSKSNWTFRKCRYESGLESSEERSCLFFKKQWKIRRWYDADTGELIMDHSHIYEPSSCTLS